MFMVEPPFITGKIRGYLLEKTAKLGRPSKRWIIMNGNTTTKLFLEVDDGV